MPALISNDTPRSNAARAHAVAQQSAEPLFAECQELERENAALREDKTRLDWLMGAIQWHTTLSLVHGEVREYRFRTPCITPTIDVRKAIDAAHANPVGK